MKLSSIKCNLMRVLTDKSESFETVTSKQITNKTASFVQYKCFLTCAINSLFPFLQMFSSSCYLLAKDSWLSDAVPICLFSSS